MNTLYYHVYLSDDPGVWSSIVLEQLKCMEDYHMLDYLDIINVTAITQDDYRKEAFQKLCDSFSSDKFNIEFVKNPWNNDRQMIQNLEHESTISENYTYRKIYEDCLRIKNEFNICYIHTKGITSTIRHLETSNIHMYKNYYYWRQYLNWGIIQNWKSSVYALDLFDVFDVAGINYYEKPSKHYSGNFWWTKSNYIKKLPDPASKEWWKKLQEKTTDQWLKTTSDRFRDEMWLCSIDNVRAFNHFTLLQHENPAGKLLQSNVYKGRDNDNRSLYE